MDDILQAIASAPWPSASHLFTSSVVTIFSLTVFAVPRIYISKIAEKYAGPDRVKRKLIIKQHIRNDHAKKLKYCVTAECKELSPADPVRTHHHVTASVASEFSI